jgi:hypothetical protein
MKGEFKGNLVAGGNPSPGAFQATLGEMKGLIKGAYFPTCRCNRFESYQLTEDTETATPAYRTRSTADALRLSAATVECGAFPFEIRDRTATRRS